MDRINRIKANQLTQEKLSRLFLGPHFFYERGQYLFGDLAVFFAARIVEDLALDLESEIVRPTLHVQDVDVLQAGPAVREFVLGTDESRDVLVERQSLGFLLIRHDRILPAVIERR